MANDESKHNPLPRGAKFAEDFLLEYTNGMPEVGWGRVTREDLNSFLDLRVIQSYLTHGPKYSAQVKSSNLASHILRTLEQGVAGRAVDGAIGTPGDRLVVIAGHDGNISSLGYLLGMAWLADGRPHSPTMPGGALVFELWQSASGSYSVRTYYITQTLDQMRNGDKLSLQSPPVVAPIFIQGCGSAGTDFEAPFEDFRTHWESAIDPKFVQP